MSRRSGLPDKNFDLVVSIFGAMFAPRPFDVAKEMVRVTRSGGRIVMGNWILGHPTLVAQILKISAAYTPPPPEGFISPMLWGVEEHVTERFVNAGVAKENISFEKDSFTFSAPYDPPAFVKTFKNYYGPTMNALKLLLKMVKKRNCSMNWRNCSIVKTTAQCRALLPSLLLICV